MTLFWKKKKEKVRIQDAVPSFFVSIGKDVSVSGPKEARKVCEEYKPCAVVLVPDESVFSASRSWASALSSAAYLVVVAGEDDRKAKAFMRVVDSVIFSPLPRRLSSAFLVDTHEKASSLINGVKDVFPAVITMRVKHEENKESFR